MSTIVLLQGLHPEASSRDVRGFFVGLQITQGGVHITTSNDGSVFVTFNTHTHAETAVNLYQGGRILGNPVKLSICSLEQKDLILRYLDEQEIMFDGFQLEDESRSKYSRHPPGLDEQGLTVVPHQQNEAIALSAERNEADRNECYYVRIHNLSPDTTVQNVMAFLKGIQRAIPLNSIMLRNEMAGTRTIAAFVKLYEKDAFETVLRMDQSYLNGNCLWIRKCSQEIYDVEKTQPPVRDLTPPPPNIHNHEKAHYEEGFKERNIQKQYDIGEHHSNQDKHAVYEHQKPQPYTVQSAHNQKPHQNQTVLDAIGRPMNQPVSRVQEIVAIPILFLTGLDNSISPRDIRNLFGELAEFIPSSGILIRPDIMRVDAYVAFVRFLDLGRCQRAAIIWKVGYQTQMGTKILFSMCTERNIQEYSLDNIWKLGTAGIDTRENIEQTDRSTYMEPQRQAKSPPSDLGVMPREVPMTSENQLLCKKPTQYEVSNETLSTSPGETLSTLPREMSEMQQTGDTSCRSTLGRPLDRKQPASYSGSLERITDQDQLRSFESNQSLRQPRSSNYSVIETFIRCSQIHSQSHSPIELHSEHRPSRKQDQDQFIPFRIDKSFSQLHASSNSRIKSSRTFSPKRSRSRSPIEHASRHEASRKPDRAQLTSFQSLQSSTLSDSTSNSPMQISGGGFPMRSQSHSPAEGRSGDKASPVLKLPHNKPLASYDPPDGGWLPGSGRPTLYAMSPGPEILPPRPRNVPPGPMISPLGPMILPPVPSMPPPEPSMPPPGPMMPPPGTMSPLGPRILAPGPRMPYPGSRMPPLGSRMAPPRSRMPPPGARMPPHGPRMPPYGPRMPPYGPRMPPCGPSMPPCGPRMSPLGPTLLPREPSMPPRVDASHPGYSATPPVVHSIATSAADGGGHYLRMSPLPEWVNTAWIYKFFRDCGVKDGSVFIKFKNSKPRYADLAFETDADSAKALLKDGVLVETTRIRVAPLEDYNLIKNYSIPSASRLHV